MEKIPLNERTEYLDREFCDALNEYRNQDIIKSIYSKNTLVRMFAVLDRRIGKRTLLSIKEHIEEEPDWLRQFYKLRIDAENI